MRRKVIYWVTTGFLAALGLFAGVTYLAGSREAVTGFAHVGYPQQLRLLLGIAKPLGAIALLVPGWPRLKEWAYAAVVAHYLADGPAAALPPLVFLVLLGVSYATRPIGRQ